MPKSDPKKCNKLTYQTYTQHNIYKRKIESHFQSWKQNNNRKPLVVKGVRQCGKTSSVLSFAKANYKHVIYIDFHQQPQLKSIFNGSLDIDYLSIAISAAIPSSVFEPHHTCLIFDEIQDCQKARSSLKFFKLDGRYDVICTGSLLGVNGYRTERQESGEASIPVGFEDIVDMYPMGFEEWLWANGIKEPVFKLLSSCMESETPVPDAIHLRMRELFLQYVIVGGMPEAIATFLQTRDTNQTIRVQRQILDEYKADMVKYALPADKPHIRECFESIPRQLGRDNKKFTYAMVRKGGRSKEYQGSLQWIEDAGIVRRCHNLNIPELPFSGNAIQNCFKIYMADTGLFVSMLDDGTQFDIIKGNLYGYKGAIFENALADIFGKMGRKPYYYQKADSLEIGFFIRYQGKATPIECKAKNGNAKSLKTLLKHQEKYHVEYGIKLGDYNIGRNGRTLTLPHYMAFMLTQL